MKNITIGILAGMGPRSTTPFLELVLDQCQAQYGAKYDIDYPHIVIYSLPTPFYVDREIDDGELKKSIVMGVRKLDSFGVDYIAVPCNTAHKYFDELQKNSNAKLLSIVDATMERIPEEEKTTVFATESTMSTNLYQEGIEKRHGKYCFLPKWQDDINRIISMIKESSDKSILLQYWNDLMREVESRGVQNIVIACTDLSVMVEDNRTINLIDSSLALAISVVNEYVVRKEKLM